MARTRRGIVVLLAVLSLVLVSCGSNDGGDSGAGGNGDGGETDTGTGSDAEAGGGEAGGGGGGSAGTATFGDEELTFDNLLCYFKEQPRAGLGGVFTHTAQGRATNADGEQVVLDMSRARAEDGQVEDDISLDFGDPTSDQFSSYGTNGPEGTIEFGDQSVSAQGLTMTPGESQAEPLELSFALTCTSFL